MQSMHAGAARWLPFVFAAGLLFAATVEGQTLGMPALTTGDCATTSTGSVQCTKTRGVGFAPSATTDTTNAANIVSGRLRGTQMPASSNGTILYRSYAYTSTSYANDYTTVGTAPAIDAVGHLQFNSTAGSVTGQQAVVSSVVTNSENWAMKATFVLGTVGSSGSPAGGYGLVLGAKSVNPNAPQGMLLNYSTSAGALSISTFSGTGQGSSPLASVALPTPSVGDTVTLVFARRGATMYGIAQNGGAVTTVQWTDPLRGTSGNSILPNTSQFAVLDFGGTYTMTNLAITENSASNPNLCILGDSKTDGVGAFTMSSRWASMIDQYGPVDVFAGGGDMTAQVLAAFPVLVQKGCSTVVLASPFYNDLGWGTATATWQANYSSVVSQAKAAGMKVIHMLSIPTSNGQVNATAANAWVSQTYGPSGAGDTVVDPSVNFNASTMLIGDGIHPNYLGYAVVAADFVAQSGLTAAAGPVTYTVPSPLALYGQP
ncbi:hypothetical protein GCM10022270_09220 [Terriglobus aquaticus]